MSQTVRFVKVNDVFYPEVFTVFPDKEEAMVFVVEMVEDEELDRDEEYEISAIWYEVGEGESRTDEFFTDKELIRMCENGNYDVFEKRVKERGYEVHDIQKETIFVYDSEMEFDE